MARSSFACKNCGQLVSASAKACPVCGSDENTGWSEQTYLDGVDLPFDDDDYADFKSRETIGNDGKEFKITENINWKIVIGVMLVSSMFASIIIRGCG